MSEHRSARRHHNAQHEAASEASAPSEHNEGTHNVDNTANVPTPTFTAKVRDNVVTLNDHFRRDNVDDWLTDQAILIFRNAVVHRFQSMVTGRDAALVKADKPAMTADEIVAEWNAGYLPNVNDGVSVDAMEKMRQDAGWLAFVSLATQHNAMVNAKAESHIFPKQALYRIPSLLRGKAAVGNANDPIRTEMAALSQRMLNSKRELFIETVQAELDKLVAKAEKEAAERKAEREAAKAEAEAAAVPVASALDDDAGF